MNLSSPVSSKRVLSVSFYGAGLASSGAQYSGAYARQKEYAGLLSAYDVLVPGAKSTTQSVEQLRIESVPSRGIFSFMWSAYWRAQELHRENAYDVIMVDNPHLGAVLGYALARRLHTPLIVHAMADTLGNAWYRRERSSHWAKQILMRVAFRVADVYRVSTQFEIDRLRSLRYDTSNVVNVPFYINQQEFVEKLNAVTSVRESKRILSVGRLGPQKDVQTLIRAFKLLHTQQEDARLTIVGAGPDEAHLRSLAEKLHLSDSVVFLGAVPYERIAEEYTRASIFSISSLYEGTCMVLHEAALAGCAIVATDTAGAHDLLSSTHGENSAGWLVPVRNHAALAEALTEALLNPAERTRRANQAKERVEKRGKEVSLSAFTSLIQKATVPGDA